MKPVRPLLALAAALCVSAPLHAADEPTPAPAAVTAPAAATPSPEIAAEVDAQGKTADGLWNYIKKYSGTDELEHLDASLDPDAKMARAREIIKDKLAHLRPSVGEFLKRYPQDPRRYDAKLLRVFFLRDDENLSDADADKLITEVAFAPEASLTARQQARAALLQGTLEKADPANGLTPAVEKELAAYERDFPDDATGAQLVAVRLRLLQDSPDKINGVLAALAKSPNKATAESAARQLDIRTRPVDLKFTALDGKEIDLARLRGKVVVLDFWATWCAPCMAKLPELTALQKKYRDKDFQLIGVSLDEDKAALEKVIKGKALDWPQVFEGRGWQDALPARFGVQVLPAAWLLDKKGLAHEVDPDADLDEEVGKLLAADGEKKL